MLKLFISVVILIVVAFITIDLLHLSVDITYFVGAFVGMLLKDLLLND